MIIRPNYPIEIDDPQERHQQHLKEMTYAKAEYHRLRSEGKDTYLLSGDSMKCMICKTTRWNQLEIKFRHCIICNIDHEESIDE